MKKWLFSIKTWIQTYKRHLIISSLGLILLIGTGIFVFNYRLSQVFQAAMTYYEDNDLMSFEKIRYELYATQGKKFDEFLMQEAQETLDQFKENEMTYYEAIGTAKRIESFANRSSNIQSYQEKIEELKQSRKAFDQFKENEMTYYEAIGTAKRIESFANRSSNIQSYQEKIEELKQSRKAFDQAEAYAIEKEWESAYHYYQQVVEWDPNYEKAQQLADSAKRWWLQQILVEAIAYYEEGDYEQSLSKIDEGLALSPDHETFLDLKDDVHLAMTKGETENKWSEFKDKITSSIQSGIESLQNIFNKIFKR